jgi:hypothetical protein
VDSNFGVRSGERERERELVATLEGSSKHSALDCTSKINHMPMNTTSRDLRNSDYRDACSAGPSAKIGQGRQNVSHSSGCIRTFNGGLHAVNIFTTIFEMSLRNAQNAAVNLRLFKDKE